VISEARRAQIREEERFRAEVRAQTERGWNPGVAAVLSFFIPGLGQLYKGQPLNALAWLIIVAAGYFMLFVPGLILHGCCILGALMDGSKSARVSWLRVVVLVVMGVAALMLLSLVWNEA